MTQEPGSDWREVPWHKRDKEQRRAAAAHDAAERKAKASARKAAIRERHAERTAQIKADGERRQAEIRAEGAARPQWVSRSRRDPNVQAYRALRAQAWMSNIQLGLMLLPILIVVLAVIGFIVFVVAN